MVYNDGYLDEYILLLPHLYYVDENIDVFYILSLSKNIFYRRYIPLFYVKPTQDIIRYSDV